MADINYVYPDGPTEDDLAMLKYANAKSSELQAKEDLEKQNAREDLPVRAGGIPPSTMGENVIMSFADLKTKLGAIAMNGGLFMGNGVTTLHEYLMRIMQEYYYQLYYIPNLQNNMVIVVKPETLFVQAPSCNVIYPNMKASITLTRNFKAEPTRIVQNTSPAVFGNTAGQQSLMCILFVEETPIKVKDKDGNETQEQATRYGMPLYETKIRPSSDYTHLTQRGSAPMAGISNYEKRNGIQGMRTEDGSDTFIYLASKQGTPDNYFTVGQDDIDMAGNAIAKLAAYNLVKARLAPRSGSISMYFDPYLVPGFPFVSLESSEGCNIFGYIVSIAHNFTGGEWSTVVNFNCARFDYENVTPYAPIMDEAYAASLDQTYKDLLGDNVKRFSNDDVQPALAAYENGKQYVSTSFRSSWRPLTDFDEYMKEILGEDTKVIEEKNFQYIESKFFDKKLQERIKQYSTFLMNDQSAQGINDVR